MGRGVSSRSCFLSHIVMIITKPALVCVSLLCSKMTYKNVSVHNHSMRRVGQGSSFYLMAAFPLSWRQCSAVVRSRDVWVLEPGAGVWIRVPVLTNYVTLDISLSKTVKSVSSLVKFGI